MTEDDNPRPDEAAPDDGTPIGDTESAAAEEMRETDHEDVGVDSPGGAKAPIPLESDPTPTLGSEPCPNCGAMLPDEGLVCLRCGYDLKALRQHETTTGVTETPEPDEAAPDPVVSPGLGGVPLPAIVALIGIAILVICYLAGWEGLFPSHRMDEVTARMPELTFMQRLGEAGRGIALAAIWTTGGIAALFAMAGINARTFGDVRLAVVRMLAIVVAVRLVTLINLPRAALEITLEMLIQIPLFVGLSMLLFRQRLHDAGLTLAVTIISVVGIWLIGVVVTTIGVV